MRPTVSSRYHLLNQHVMMCLLALLLMTGCGGGSDKASGGVGWGPGPDANQGLAPYSSTNPQDSGDGWTVSTPEAEGMDAQQISTAFERIRNGTYRGVDSVVVVKNERLIAEAYFNGYGEDTLHDLRSASKSITSALVGIAVEQDFLATEETLDDFITGLDGYQNPDPRKASIKVVDLLNMSSGLACNDWDQFSPGQEEKMYRTLNWIKFVLDLPMEANPGERARYCTGGVILLGHMITIRSGLNLDDFASLNLFGPLGIDNVWWRRSPNTLATGGGGMRLRPRDAAKFGQLYLNDGVWNDQQVLSSHWVEESKKSPATLVTQIPEGYGLLWWKRSFLVRGEMQEAFYASGNGGNYIFLFPEENLAVVFTGSNYNSDLGNQPYEILEELLLPALL